MEARRAEQEDEEVFQALRQDWFFGSETFKRELLQRVERQLGEHHAGVLHREVSQARAERIMAEELRRLGWSERDLVEARKSDGRKLAIAARLRRETTLRLKQIATLLHLGTSKSANTTLHRLMSAGAQKTASNSNEDVGM